MAQLASSGDIEDQYDPGQPDKKVHANLQPMQTSSITFLKGQIWNTFCCTFQLLGPGAQGSLYDLIMVISCCETEESLVFDYANK